MRKKDTPHASDPRTTPIMPIDFMTQAQQAWQMPLMFYTWWWNEALKMFWGPNVILRNEPTVQDHPHHADEHGQLVVPEPIEEEGEHALFA